MLHRRVRFWGFVELPPVVVIEMRSNEPMFRPTIDRLLMDTEAICHLPLVQHSALAKPIMSASEGLRCALDRLRASPKSGQMLGLVARMRPDETLAR